MRRGLDTGIVYAVLAPGLVPLYEQDAARVEAGYTLPAWRAADWRDRAREIAHYRVRRLIALHVQDAQNEYSERESRKRR